MSSSLAVGEDPYDVLGIARGASPADVRRAYLSLSLVHHPDRGGDAVAFHRIQAAHDTLSDGARRGEHDARAMAEDAKGRAAGGVHSP
jgi:DnaJ family protein A protein 2